MDIIEILPIPRYRDSVFERNVYRCVIRDERGKKIYQSPVVGTYEVASEYARAWKR
jgi:hypothetical protein